MPSPAIGWKNGARAPDTTVVLDDGSSGLASIGDYKLYFVKAVGTNKDGALTPDGIASGHIDEGELDTYTFTATAGQHIFLRVADITGGSFFPTLAIYGPAGDLASSASGGNVAGVAFDAASTGTYTVVLDDGSSGLASTGDYKLYFVKAVGTNKDGALTPDGIAAGHIDEGELDTYTFTATAGQHIFLRVADITGGSFFPTLAIYGPAGDLASSASGGNVAGVAFDAASTGTYTVVLDDGSSGLASIGDYKLYFVKAVGTNKDGALTPDGITAGHIDEGELDTYTFTAVDGEGVTLQVTDLLGGTFFPTLTIYGPAGNLASSASGGNVATAAFSASSTGTYTVVLDDGSSGPASTGNYQVSLHLSF